MDLKVEEVEKQSHFATSLLAGKSAWLTVLKPSQLWLRICETLQEP